MLDFKELPNDGQAFEQLVRELLFSRGLHVHWSGRGADSGRDLICHERIRGLFAAETRGWLVQCKHFAHSGRSVGVSDLDDVVDSCTQHQTTGYLLVCSTQPSSAVVQRLEAITANTNNPITATYWDAVALERLLSVPRQWAIAQRFLPASTGAWRLYATERPNDFVAHYRGYVFHLSNRIGSQANHHLPSIENRVAELETLSLSLPAGHFLRPRAVWYDDKNGGYTWYIDYMYPHSRRPSTTSTRLADALHEGRALEDGQLYHWDIKFVQYSQYSDHYDKDHYDYYVRYLPSFFEGARRTEENREEYFITLQEIEQLQQEAHQRRHLAFKALLEAFTKLPFVRVVRGINAGVEDVHKFERRFVWSDLMDHIVADVMHLFDTLLILEVNDEKLFHDLLSLLPNDVNQHFRVARVYMYLPERGLSDDGPPIYDLRLSIHPAFMRDEVSTRSAFNTYFDLIRGIVETFQAKLG